MSTPLDELFSDEISELQKHVKSEEEINKYSTQDDLGEVRRAIFILKKGYQSQKESIIENLDKVMTEAGANEDFLPIILCSMEIWDMTMQLECAKSFKRDSVLSLMSPANHLKLTDELLNILFGADVTQEAFVNEWLLVFKNLCAYLNLEYIRYTVIKRIAELPSLKQTMPWRKIGFEMFWSLAMAKGEELIKSEPLMMKTIVSMCTDNNWRIRRDAAKYLKEFLSELNKWKQVAPKPSPRKHNEPRKSTLDRADSHVFSAKSPRWIDRKQIEAKQVQQLAPVEKIDVSKIKLTKEKFREDFYDIMAELLSDRELLVRIEGIDMFIEYQDFLTREDFERDFVPHLMETLEMLTKDDSADDEAEIRMIRNLGPIADRLSQFGILRVGMSDDMRLEKTFIEYFKSCMTHPVKDVRKGAAYNLPCFFLHFRFWEPNLESSFNEFDDSRSFLDRFYLEVCQDPETAPDMLKTLAAGIHEVMQLFTQDLKLPAAISESLRYLFNTSHFEVKEVLADNIDYIIKYYLRKEDQRQLVEELKLQSEELKKGDCGGGVRIVFAGKKPLLKEGSASNLANDETRIGSPKRKPQAIQGGNKEKPAFTFGQDSNKTSEQSLVPLMDTLDIEYCPEEWHHEYVFSRLLDQMMPLIDSIFNDKTKWRIQALFIRKFGNALEYFNPVELQELIYPKVIERMRGSNDQVKQSGAWFIANLIANQYRHTQRQQLIETVVNELGKSKTFSLRKCFIMFCVSAIQVISFETFKQNFFSLYLSMAEDRIADVRISFLNSAVEVRPYLELDPTALNEFNLVLSTFLMDQSPTIFELTNQVDMKLLRLKRSINLVAAKAEEASRVAFEQKLKERDLQETEARLQNGGDKKSKIELVTIYHFSNMLKKNRGNPLLFGGSAAIAGMLQPSLQKKQTMKAKKQNQTSPSNPQSTTPPPQGKVPSSATPPPLITPSKLPSSQSLIPSSIPPELSTTPNGSVASQKALPLQTSIPQSGLEVSAGLSTTLSATISKFKKKLAKKENAILPPIQQSNIPPQQQAPIKNTPPVRKVDINLAQTLNIPPQQQQNNSGRQQPENNNGRLSPLGSAKQPQANVTLDNANSSQENIILPPPQNTDDIKFYTHSKLLTTATGRYGIKRGPYHQQFHQNMKERLSTHEPMLTDPATPQNMNVEKVERVEMPSEVKHILWKNSISNSKLLNPQGSLSQFQMMSNGLGNSANKTSSLGKRRVSSEDFENMTTQVSLPISNPTTSSMAKRNPQITLANLSQDEPQTLIVENAPSAKFLTVQNNSLIRTQPRKPPLQVQFTTQASPLNSTASQKVIVFSNNRATNNHFFNSPQATAITHSIIQGAHTPQMGNILPPLSQILSIRSTNNYAKVPAPKIMVDLSEPTYYSTPQNAQESNFYESQKRAQSSGGQQQNMQPIEYQRQERQQQQVETGYNEKMRLNMLSVAQQQSRMVNTTTLNFKYGLARQSTMGQHNSRNLQQKPQVKSFNNESTPPIPQSLHKPQQFKTQQQRRDTTQVAEHQKVASAIVRRIVSPKDFGGQHSITSQLLVKGSR